MVDSRAAAEAGALLRRIGFVSRVERARTTLANVWEPWVGADATRGSAVLPRTGRTELDAVFGLLHLGQAKPRTAVGDETARTLLDAGLCRLDDGDLLPGQWRVSAFRGMLAAADSEYGSSTADIHLGEDSLRFTSAVLDIAPTGAVLDVGSGSGISTSAAARSASSVLAVDILPRAREATELTAALNGVADRCRAEVADLNRLDDAGRFDTVIANLPGVPVPAALPYPAAGDGGPDGLALIRRMWDWYGGQRQGALVMRFQSLGSATAPAVLTELAQRFGNDHEVLVVTDSAVPVLVRDAITSERAAALAGRPVDDVLAEITAERTASGHSHFHCSTLKITRGGRGVHHVPDHVRLDADTRFHSLRSTVDFTEVAMAYVRSSRLMPDEFWSVDGNTCVAQVLQQLPELTGALRDGTTPGELASGLARSGRATEHAALSLANALLAHVLVSIGTLGVKDRAEVRTGVSVG